MKIFSLIFALIVFPCSISTAYADAAPGEIHHLINYLAISKCSFIRNGSAHSSSEAVAHMEKKYRYFRRKIKSAEQFIEFSASKSTLSGEPYWIKCPGTEEQLSSVWLLAELQRYRQSR